MAKVNLGAGKDILEGWINYDLMPQDPSVTQIDLEKDTFELENDSVEYIAANDLLEHIINLRHLMNECHRILKSNGIFSIEVPRFPHEDSVKDPTHVRFFVPETFKYFADYTSACEMYGFKQWRILTQRNEPHRIFIKLSPIK